MKFVQFLGDSGFKAELSGKKAAPLDLLIKKGLKIPSGFTLSPDLSTSTKEVRDEILGAVSRIGGYPVAVRSSSNLEDLGDASFAGLYETYLNVSSDEALFECIEKCFASGRGERVQTYLKTKGWSVESMAVSVLIQKMVDAQTSGVFFGIHPTEGKEEEAYIEACRGLGERLVSGHATPSSYQVNLNDGSVIGQTISDDGDCISHDRIRELTRIGLAIMAEFGSPQDIEWAIDSSDQLWILQSRPITRIQWRSDVEEYTNADFKDGGVSASVCTPLMYSLYEAAMQNSMQAYMKKIRLLPARAEQKTWIKMFYGRAYWNASEVKRRLIRVPGFDEEAFDQDLGIQKHYGEKGPVRVPTHLGTILPVIPVALALEKEYRDRLVWTERYDERIYLPRERALKAKLKLKLNLMETVGEVIDFQYTVECDYFSTIYSNTNLQGDFKKLIRDQETRYGFHADLTKLFSGVEGISHLQVQAGWIHLVSIAQSCGLESSDFKKAQDEFLTRHGFHADRELDLSTPRWSEIPEMVQTRVKELLNASSRLVNPAQSQTIQKEQYENEKNRLLELIGSSRGRKKFLRELDRVRIYLRRREEMREVSTRAYALVREAILKLAQLWVSQNRLNDPFDIFFLTRDEIKAGEVPDITFRKLMYYAYRNLVPPNELGFGTHAIQSGSWQGEDAALLKGLGCSPGVTRGRVRVVNHLEDAYRLQDGEILVTRFTDPGWTAVLGLVSGVITEVGGMLSHAAVIGRELGVPAILNLPKATELLKTGDHIEMNGSSGEIKIVSQVTL